MPASAARQGKISRLDELIPWSYAAQVARIETESEPLMSQVDPMQALESFEMALGLGQIATQPGALDPELRVHVDRPNGQRRFTYVWTKESRVKAIAILSPVEPVDGIPCFQIGCATGENFRGKGLAKAIVKASIAELHNGLSRNDVPLFYVEAVVDAENLASQHVAAATLSKEPTRAVDKFSGRPALQYLMRVGAAPT